MGTMSRTLFKRNESLPTSPSKTRQPPSPPSNKPVNARPKPPRTRGPVNDLEWPIVLWLLESSQKTPKLHVRVWNLSGSGIKKKKKYYVSTYIDGAGHMESSAKKADRNGHKLKWSGGDLNWIFLDPEKVKNKDIKLRFEVWRVRRFWRDAKEGTTKIVKASDLITADDRSEDNVSVFYSHRANLKLVRDGSGSENVADFKVEFTFLIETWK